ncbi:MAG: isoprenylcysteine carboxylmethyltransferase family protein [Alphaproteobacteria bacterium]|nr:isoprenylcysteine carboxylmethyltransferase family protein [Alphaproteobacteria bacterium]MBV9377497.1 isoprenylcysteine carboxylmethyltransferase family protein [Alphaproteobacteria bacterium]
MTPRLSAAVQSIGVLLLVGVCLFGSAGRLDIPMFWSYLAVFAGVCIAALLLIDEDLTQERMRPGGQPLGFRLWLAFLLCIAHWVVAGLDRGRFHWSDNVPLPLRLAAIVVFAAGLSLFLWAMYVNRFFSSVVRIQQERGHRVVTGGPYRWVRHPGYAGALPAMLASGVALCSWLATAIGLLGLPLLLWRILAEERTLKAELPGYPEYAQSVRWRLFPGVW